jgi:hypothetical protein
LRDPCRYYRPPARFVKSRRGIVPGGAGSGPRPFVAIALAVLHGPQAVAGYASGPIGDGASSPSLGVKARASNQRWETFQNVLRERPGDQGGSVIVL